MTTFVYGIRMNVPGHRFDGRIVYVGVTDNLEKRWSEHLCSKRRKPLVAAMNKYGRDRFSIETIETHADRSTAFDRERAIIASLDTLHDSVGGYNLANGGERVDHTPEIRARMSAGLKRRWSDPDFAEKQKSAMVRGAFAPEVHARRLEKIRSADCRRSKGAAVAASWMNEDVRSRRLAGMRGNAEAMKVRMADPEIRRRANEASRVARQSDSYKARRSEITKRVFSDPDIAEKHRKATSEATRAAYNRPEVRQRHADAMNRQEVRDAHSKKSQEKWKDPVTVARMGIGRSTHWMLHFEAKGDTRKAAIHRAKIETFQKTLEAT